MTIHKIILPYTPSSVKEFFDDIEKIEKKISNGEDYVREIEKIEAKNDYYKIQERLQRERRIY